MWRSLKLSRKLTLVLWSTALALLLMGGGLFWYHERMYPRRVQEVLEPYVQLLSVGLERAISLHQTNRAQEVLTALRAAPMILEASLVKLDGQVLARYQKDPSLAPRPAVAKPDQLYTACEEAELVRTLSIEGQPVARLHLFASPRSIKAQTQVYTYGLLGGGMVLLGLTAWQTWLIRKTVAGPVQALEKAMDRVRAQADPQPRVTAIGGDEIARLAAHFNAMMEALESQKKALQNTNEFLQAILDNAAHAIICIQPDGIITSFNPAAERLLGYTAGEVVGKKTPLIFHDPEELAERKRELSEALELPLDDDLAVFIQPLKKQPTYEREWTYVHKDGRRLPVWLVLSTLRDAHGNTRGYLGLAEDLTLRKRQENELRQKNEELERFTYTVSHDLKSPLITIKGFVSEMALALREGRHESLPEDFKRVAAAADKMSELLNDLLELSRIGRVTYPPTDVPLDQLVQEVLMVLEGVIRERGVEVMVLPGLPTVRGDRRRLFEVFLNLIENAVKFMGPQERPRVEIGCIAEGAQPVIYVQDNGLGVPPMYQETIFGLFNKLNSATPGTGIGLAIVRRIVEFHGGRIWVESEGRGQGSRFCFTLGGGLSHPAAAPAAERARAP